MTRQKWTTPEQEAWLEERKPAFLLANQTKRAARNFYPDLVKEFRDKWPVPPVSEAEIADAGSVELATRVKKEKYDKRTTSWYPNNTRTVNAHGGARNVLKVTSPPQPRKLQAWQAYHALTYENKWKPHVDEAWTTYKEKWLSEHPNEKPEKNRFSIMVEFMRARFNEESEEMKKHCEEYRKPEMQAELNPEKVKPQAAINEGFQSAIDMLPRTLATIGESLMTQTGWNITILAGGPMPDTDGMILTYLSHSGKTKGGDSFEKFLGQKEYDEHILVPFEKFLRASFSEEDCAARALVKDDPAEENAQESGSKLGDDNEEEMDDDEWKRQNGEGEENENESGDVDQTKKEVKKSVGVLSEYEKIKAKNVAELKLVMENLKENYPFPEDLVPKPALEKPSAKKAKKKERQPPVERRASTRNKGGDNGSSSSIPPPKAALHDVAAVGASTPVSPVATAPNPNLSVAASSGPVGSTPISTPVEPIPISTPVEPTPTSTSVEPTAASTPVEPTPTSTPVKPTAASTPVEPTPTSTPMNSVTPSQESLVIAGGISAIAALPAEAENAEVARSPHPVIPTQSPSNDDVDMRPASPGVPPSPKPKKDDNLSPWLSLMIDYLRGVSEDAAWQGLVTEFVDFEKRHPPNGNLPTNLRPKEVTDWIKSKKKDVVPSIHPGEYGDRFMGWWRNLQPSWRKNNLDPSFPLFRDVPEGETWQSLRKGGTAGIYVVVVSLSWWVKAQSVERDVNAWSVVDDLLWVIQQMKRDLSPPPPTLKRAHNGDDNDDEDKGQRRKIRRVSD